MTPAQMMERELRTDFVHYFSNEGQSIAKKKNEGAELSKEERSVYDREIKNWWQDKYGFPYEQRDARDEVLARKYMVGEELSARRMLQQRLFKAVYDNDMQEIGKLRDEYEQEFPDQLEGHQHQVG